MRDELSAIVPLKDALSGVGLGSGLRATSESELMKFLERQNGWNALHNWEDLPDSEIYKKLVEMSPPLGMVFVIAESSYRAELGAFEVHADRLAEFVAGYYHEFNECLFNGDLLIISGGQGLVWAFHHEGAYTTFAFA
jgi:hypothetical protein